MKNSRNIFFSIKTIILVNFLIINFACQSNTKETLDFENSDTIHNISTDTTKTQIKSQIYTKYKLPLPVSLYLFLRDNKAKYDYEVLCSPNEVDKYLTTVSKAMILGIYTSDLAYCTVYEQNQEAINYMNVAKKLSEDLGIHAGYDMQNIQRSNDNIGNFDSLNIIATEAYWKACLYLEENENVNILPFVVVGGWLESMHLTMVNAKSSGNEKNVNSEIIKQKEALNNLTTYLLDVMMDSNTFQINKDVQILLRDLEKLKKTFKKHESNTDNMTITDNQFSEIAKHVASIRKKYI